MGEYSSLVHADWVYYPGELGRILRGEEEEKEEGYFQHLLYSLKNDYFVYGLILRKLKRRRRRRRRRKRVK